MTRPVRNAQGLRSCHTVLKKQQLTDAVLISGLDETRIKTHRLLLAAYSEYLKGLFIKPNTSTEIVVEKMNLKTNRWMPNAPMLTKRKSPSSVVFENKLYIVGGYNKGRQ